MKKIVKRTIWTAVIAIVVTAIAMLILFNLNPESDGLTDPVEPRAGVGEPEFVRAMSHLLGPPLVEGNRITALDNGEEIFPAMLEAIRGAERSITFETYVYWSGEVAERFADALSERARAGVPVHVLLDWVGSVPMEQKLIDQMEEAGVEVERYHPLRWYHLDRLNNRTHRKLLVVDGRVGFTGGVGIADIWQGRAQDPDHWRDIHVQVEGPVVATMQAVFMENWLRTRSRLLYGEDYFPALEPAGSTVAQMFSSSPRDGSETARLAYMMLIAGARETIDIGNAYFVPDRLALDALLAARRRGVAIRILLPGRHIDSDLVKHASRGRWGEPLAAGIEVYQFQPTMYHAKLMIVDGRWVTIGSTNFDPRSFQLNDEANLNVLDAEFARHQREIFERDLERAERMTYEAWEQRPWHEKLMEKLVSLVRDQL